MIEYVGKEVKQIQGDLSIADVDWFSTQRQTYHIMNQAVLGMYKKINLCTLNC